MTYKGIALPAVKASTSGTTISPPYPTGGAAAAAGETLLCVVSVNGTTVPTLPSGWSSGKSGTGTASQTPAMHVFGIAATGSESGNLTVTVGAVTGQAVIMAYTNPFATGFDGAGTIVTPAASTTLNIPGLTPSQAGDTLVIGGSSATAGGNFNTSASLAFTKVYDDITGTTAMAIEWVDYPSTSATGTIVLTRSSTIRSIGWMIALPPVASSSPATATGSLTLGASGNAAGDVGGTGSLTLSSSGSANAAGTGTAALALSGSGAANAAGTGTAAIALAGSGAARAATAGTAAITLAGTGAARAVGTGTGSVTLAATGSAGGGGAASGTGSVTLAATGQAAARGAGTGSLSLTASGSGRGVASGSGSLTLAAAGAAQTLVSGAGSLLLSAAGIVAARAGALAQLVLSAVGILVGPHRRANPLREITVPAETRRITVASSDRRITVDPDPRRITVAAENRRTTIPAETRRFSA